MDFGAPMYANRRKVLKRVSNLATGIYPNIPHLPFLKDKTQLIAITIIHLDIGSGGCSPPSVLVFVHLSILLFHSGGHHESCLSTLGGGGGFSEFVISAFPAWTETLLSMKCLLTKNFIVQKWIKQKG